MNIDEIKKQMTFQDYSPQPVIEGVSVIKLKKHLSPEGGFMEYARISDGIIDGTGLKPAQISVSWAVPDRLNAFHVHPKVTQNEIWTVVQGSLLVWLVDIRDGSPTFGIRRKYLLSGEDPHMLFIPTGVAHGYKAGNNGGILLYVMDSKFNIADPNEGRLPWDFFGADLWEEDRG